VPEILLGGNHAAIAKWRREQALSKTQRIRPDLLD
jgi:tRNA (guanine37-N1)-methyltransferase